MEGIPPHEEDHPSDIFKPGTQRIQSPPTSKSKSVSWNIPTSSSSSISSTSSSSSSSISSTSSTSSSSKPEKLEVVPMHQGSETTCTLPTFDLSPHEPHPPTNKQDTDRLLSDDTLATPHHTSNKSLIAEWDQKTMQGGDGSPIVTTTGHIFKRRPPVIPPKPKTSTHSITLSTSAPYQLQEIPSSFTEPTRMSGLSPLSSSFRRPQGTRGRKLPSKYSKYGDSFRQLQGFRRRMLPSIFSKEQRRRSKVRWMYIFPALLGVAALTFMLALKISCYFWNRTE